MLMNLRTSSKCNEDDGRLKIPYLVAGTGFEPVTFGLWARRASRLLHPASFMKLENQMGGGGFEPPKHKAADLQSVPFGHSGSHPYRADERTRTFNLLITNQLLCQLSHIGILDKNGTYRARTCDPLLVRQMLSQLS